VAPTADRPRSPDAKATAPEDLSVGMHPCKFCQKNVDGAECFCFGCKAVICNDCDVSLGEYGRGHSPEDHLHEPEPITW
jgi:hypothetical protein